MLVLVAAGGERTRQAEVMYAVVQLQSAWIMRALGIVSGHARVMNQVEVDSLFQRLGASNVRKWAVGSMAHTSRRRASPS